MQIQSYAWIPGWNQHKTGFDGYGQTREERGARVERMHEPERSEVKVSAGTQPSQRSRARKARTAAQPAQQGDEETIGRQLGRLTFSPPHQDNFGIQSDAEAHEEDGDQ